MKLGFRLPTNGGKKYIVSLFQESCEHRINSFAVCLSDEQYRQKIFQVRRMLGNTKTSAVLIEKFAR